VTVEPDATINADVPPSGTGCVECLASDGGWWLHLRRCVTCGHIGCCDDSPAQHATAHARSASHPIVASFEPGEHWAYDYRTDLGFAAPPLAPPTSRPEEQGSPAPADRVPGNWLDLLND